MSVTVGVMLLQNTHLRSPGSMGHPDSYGWPAIFGTLHGITGRMLIDRPEELALAVLDTAKGLVGRGATVLTMNCGFGVLFQQRLVDALDVTTVSSSLLLLPSLRAIHGHRVGVLTFDRAALSAAHFRAAGWPDHEAPACADVQEFAEWQLLDEEEPQDLPIDRMGKQLAIMAQSLVTTNRLRAVVLECSAMVPHAARLERSLGCPVYTVFDAIELAVSRIRLTDNCA
jgi:hypothetical protein